MSLGSSLTAQNDNSASWQSPSGEFAFGFRQIGNDGFLLAIWFNKIPDKTVVWSANGNSLVAQGSKVELTADGQLLLNDIATGKDTLVASVGTGVVAYAAMLDTGNFVLANAHSNSLWESFGHPTDTILPTQTINQGSRLYAPYTSTNYSRGRFLLTLESDGNLKLYTTNFPQDYPYYGYWNYNDTLHSGFQVIFNQSGSVYLIATNGTILKVVLPYTFSNQDLYQRATIDYDGVLRYYVFRKSNDSSGGTWSALSFIPSNICISIVQKQGGGACGFNSLCNQNQDRPICRCPSGYTLMDPHDALKGCKPNFVPHSCDGASQACLADCLCDVANYRISLCFLKAIPLLNGRIDPSYNGKAFIKIRKGNSTLGSDGAAKTKRKKEYDSTLIVAGSVLLSMNLKCFTFEEIKDATNKFKEEIGRGASATVFKGVLASDNGIGNCVAVKSLDAKVRGNDVEFNAEVSAIGRTSHRNLVQLLGFCDEGEHRMLVYEFMSNGSLASFVFGESRPKWFERRHIALGIARGLLNLHEECSSQITRTTTAIRGTKGYVAPEWFKNLPITVKVDVYSFGILLLEIICCQKKFEEDAEDENQMILADWAYDCHKQNKLHLLFPNDSEPMEAIKEMEKYVMIAMRCIEEDPLLRPTMKNVTLMLEGTVEVSFPPDPSSFINSTF
ncbi:hypothetical protein C1H46_024619 [Malus baccata]|uniref:non-specific serine/threonine protein kinase n=1 Tax=Malus baccata TaxID=106549 RepID=A0A540LTL0_MALBA|nr:hypothetical protein C1H46_024619 [Malus baccata]